MMILNRIVLMLLAGLLVIGCGGERGDVVRVEKKNGSELYVCDITKVRDTIEMKLSDLVESCTHVKLENRREALVKYGFVTLTDNYIGIRGYKTPFKLFDKSGKFLRNIGRIGRGPNEYKLVYCEQIDEVNNRVFFLPWNGTKLLAFDLEGVAQSPIPLLQKLPKGAFRVRGNEVDLVSLPFKNTKYHAYTQTLRGELINGIEPMVYNRVGDFSNELPTHTNVDDFVVTIDRLGKAIADTLYHYNKRMDCLMPAFTIDTRFGKVPYHQYAELPNHFIVTISEKKQVDKNGYHVIPTGRILVDKRTKEAHYFKLKNDFYGGLGAGLTFRDGYYIASWSAFSLMEAIDKRLKASDLDDEMRAKLIAIRKDLHEEDNKVIMYGKLKS